MLRNDSALGLNNVQPGSLFITAAYSPHRPAHSSWFALVLPIEPPPQPRPAFEPIFLVAAGLPEAHTLKRSRATQTSLMDQNLPAIPMPMPQAMR
jgi:hypothetical protein